MRKYIDPAKAKIIDGKVQRTAPEPEQIAFVEKDTDKMLFKARSILARELQRLESTSEAGGLGKDDSQILISYCKELREWKKEEKETLEELTEEQLQAIVSGNTA